MSTFAIRRGRAEDASAVAAVFDAAVARGWTHLGGLEREPLFNAAQWDDLLAAHLGDDVILVAVDPTHTVLGFCAVHPGDGEMYLLFVDPAHGGRGIGRALLDAGHDALRAAGCRLPAAEKPSCSRKTATTAPWPSIREPATGLMARRARRISTGPQSARSAW